MHMATTLTSLKLSSAKKPTQLSSVQVRRNKLSNRLWEQIQLATSKQTGTPYTVNKSRTITDATTGDRRTVEMPKRLKEWWFTTDNGKLALTVRYGARTLELAKGKCSVEIANANELVGTLEIIKAAVEAGELDSAIDAASGALREAFTR